MSEEQATRGGSEGQTTEPGPEPSDVSSDDKTMALLAHLLGIFTWFIGALIIWLVKKESSPYVDDQGKEALNFQITVGLGYVAASLFSCITLGLGALVFPAIYVLNVVFCIMACVAAGNGERYRYPVSIRLVK